MPHAALSLVTVPAHPLVVPTAALGTILNDDALVLWVVLDDQNVFTFTPPTGFTAFTGFPLQLPSSGGTDGGGMWAGYKKAASESGNYSISNSGSVNGNGGIVRLTGLDAATFLHRQIETPHGSADASPWNITTGAFVAGATTVPCTVLFIGWSDNAPGGTVIHTAPAGYTKRGDVSDGAFFNSFVATLDGAASGFTGALTGVGTAAGKTAGWVGLSIAFAEASAGAIASARAIQVRQAIQRAANW